MGLAEIVDAFTVGRELFPLMLCCAVMVGLLQFVRTRVRRRRQCYLLDFTCYKPPAERMATTEVSAYFSMREEPIDPERINFRWRILLGSGLGEETSVPRFLFNEEPVATLDEARVEMEESFVGVLDELFAKTEVEPSQVDILIVTVSMFTPAPSLAAWIVNRYNMRENVKTFNLSGMGCSTGVVAVDMARDLFTSYPESLALLVGTENCTPNAGYAGNDKSFMLANCIFRVGGNAVLLSNRAQDAARAKMRLRYVVRTNTASDDEAYECIMNKEDDDGNYGIRLHHSLLDVATRALRTNLASLGPQVLPLRELLYYIYVNMWCIKVLKRTNVEPYVPNFKLAFQHFCIHPGDRAVINGIGKSLSLTDLDLEASRMALFRFGNTSTSGVWYEAAYTEAKRRFRRGDRLIQIALGAGFKCNTAVWEILRETHPLERTAWDDCIHRHPCNTRKNFTEDYCDKLLNRSPPPPPNY